MNAYSSLYQLFSKSQAGWNTIVLSCLSPLTFLRGGIESGPYSFLYILSLSAGQWTFLICNCSAPTQKLSCDTDAQASYCSVSSLPIFVLGGFGFFFLKVVFEQLFGFLDSCQSGFFEVASVDNLHLEINRGNCPL